MTTDMFFWEKKLIELSLVALSLFSFKLGKWATKSISIPFNYIQFPTLSYLFLGVFCLLDSPGSPSSFRRKKFLYWQTRENDTFFVTVIASTEPFDKASMLINFWYIRRNCTYTTTSVFVCMCGFESSQRKKNRPIFDLANWFLSQSNNGNVYIILTNQFGPMIDCSVVFSCFWFSLQIVDSKLTRNNER